jgi:RNA polymerase sigma-54 factor
MEQRLIQSPQMIQAMQILQLPALDLQERIDSELLENPFLEKVEGQIEEDETNPPTIAADPDAARLTAMLEDYERLERDFGDRRRPNYDEDGDKKQEALQNTPNAPKSLSAALIEQLAFVDFDERQRELAEYLIYSLDHRGYLTQPLEEIARECGVEGATTEELAEVLTELRRVAHPALGAADLREGLTLQLEPHGLDDPLVRQLIENHLDDITTNRLPRIAKATGSSLEEIKHALEAIRTLDPNPGAGYGEDVAAAILPDVVVEEIDGTYEVRLNRGRVPSLTLNHGLYKQLLRQARKGDGIQEWVKKRVESARWFIDAITQRQSTLQRIATKIFEHQKDFLDRGVRALHPLRMQQVADDVGVHISTVSRAVSGKYAQTPRGTYPLKYFFTGGTTTSSGEVESQASIKQRIAELVAAESKESPLSDDQLADRLEQLDNVRIARRTVTKYRKALSIPSSSQRRVF